MSSEVNIPIERMRNFGISAHIDSGKTTLSERILFYTGRIHKIEEVRGKSGVGAKMDSMDLEREKGITIQSAATFFQWKENWMNLIDTPGHVDFTIEVERALRVLDGAILVLCAVSGVQSQSITVDRQMRRYKIPRICFINKMDRAGANAYRVKDMVRDKLGLNAVFINIPIGASDEFGGVVDLITQKAVYFEGDSGEDIREAECPADMQAKMKEARTVMIEALGDVDDAVATKYLEGGEFTPEELRKAIRAATLAHKFVPVMCGSAYKNKGVQVLLDAISTYLPNPSERQNEALDLDKNEEKVQLTSNSKDPLVCLAFKLDDGRYGQLTYTRVYQGHIAKGDTIYNTANQKKVKVPRLVRMHSNEMVDIEQANAGDIVALFGVDCASGDTFCDDKVNYSLTSMHVPHPVISLAVAPKDKTGQANFSKALNRFTKEDPTFRVHRDEESGQTIVSGMGELHLEIYIERIKREYNCEVIAGKPQVAYRETIAQKAPFDYLHKKQSGGSGQFAKVVGYIEPLPFDGDVVHEFVNATVGGSIPREYIGGVEKGFNEMLKKGPLIGYPVIGLRFVATDGQHHDVDSSELAFKIAAQGAFREAYPTAKPTVLEPIMKLEVSVPEEFQGTVTGQLNQRRATIMGTSTNDRYAQIEAEVPISEMFGYSTDLRSVTQGKGEFSMEFYKYAPAPRNIQEELVQKYKEQRERDAKK